MSKEKQITIEMPKKLLSKWLKALRSGEYKQCRGVMTNGVGYCCLGVLQQVADGDVERFWDGSPRKAPSMDWLRGHNIRFLRYKGLLEGELPVLPSLGLEAAEANDSGKQFTTIADAIEKCAKGV